MLHFTQCNFRRYQKQSPFLGTLSGSETIFISGFFEDNTIYYVPNMKTLVVVLWMSWLLCLKFLGHLTDLNCWPMKEYQLHPPHEQVKCKNVSKCCGVNGTKCLFTHYCRWSDTPGVHRRVKRCGCSFTTTLIYLVFGNLMSCGDSKPSILLVCSRSTTRVKDYTKRTQVPRPCRILVFKIAMYGSDYCHINLLSPYEIYGFGFRPG